MIQLTNAEWIGLYNAIRDGDGIAVAACSDAWRDLGIREDRIEWLVHHIGMTPPQNEDGTPLAQSWRGRGRGSWYPLLGDGPIFSAEGSS